MAFLSRYKFHLALENAICNDYMTEKLWRPMHLGAFARAVDFDGLDLCFGFGGWSCLRADFYGLNAPCIMESLVLRSGTLLDSPLPVFSSLAS